MEGPEGSTKERTPTFALASTAPGLDLRVQGRRRRVGASARPRTRRRARARASTPCTPARPTRPATSTPRRPARVLQVARLHGEGHDRRRRGGRASASTARTALWVAEGSVKVNGITFNTIDGRKLRFDTDQAQALARQDPAAHQGHRALRGRARVDRARTATRSRSRSSTSARSRKVGRRKPTTPRARSTSRATTAPTSRASSSRARRSSSCSRAASRGAQRQRRAAEGLPDAEGNGLTGAVEVESDNVRGIHLSGPEDQGAAGVRRQGRDPQPLPDLRRRAQRRRQADLQRRARRACSWEGGAEAIVLPTPDKLRIENVGIGFADGGFNHATAR